VIIGDRDTCCPLNIVYLESDVDGINLSGLRAIVVRAAAQDDKNKTRMKSKKYDFFINSPLE
jgi:hypothetical protein